MPQPSLTFSLSEQQNSDFAALSGDYNPLHVDPVYSRRLQFGQPVIHGIHHMLRAWDETLAQSDHLSVQGLSYLSATFPNPVSVGQTIEYQYEISDDAQALSISAQCNAKTILSLRLKFTAEAPTGEQGQVIDECPPQEQPITQSFPPEHSEGKLPLFLDHSLSKRLFPNLSRLLTAAQIAQIISCTRIVGMKCPGMHSIFSRISLEFPPSYSNELKGHLHYSEEHKDQRVQIMRIAVRSANVQGRLDTFFRPSPFNQPGYQEICRQVQKGIFSGQRALIIGGSRGVGETTAKILAAGGADVIISYNSGKGEAQQVKDEIDAASGQCQIMQLNVCDPATNTPLLFAGDLPPSHIYYFASPHIQANRSAKWDVGLFQKFCRFYLQAFSETVNVYASAASKADTPIQFFYPSTIYIDETEKGFSEYTVAKAAGEALCGELAQRYPKATFLMPRLARMSTDQTSSIIPIKCESTFDVMYQELQK